MYYLYKKLKKKRKKESSMNDKIQENKLIVTIYLFKFVFLKKVNDYSILFG